MTCNEIIARLEECEKLEDFNTRAGCIGLLLQGIAANGVECPLGGKFETCRDGKAVVTILEALTNPTVGRDDDHYKFLFDQARGLLH